MTQLCFASFEANHIVLAYILLIASFMKNELTNTINRQISKANLILF
jgi:hypothetical protein